MALKISDVSSIVIIDIGADKDCPTTQHRWALKALTLGIPTLLNCHLAAEFTDLLGRQLIELLCQASAQPVPDWLTMAVPTRNIRSSAPYVPYSG